MKFERAFWFVSVHMFKLLMVRFLVESLPGLGAAPIAMDVGHIAPVGDGIRKYGHKKRSKYWDISQINGNICPPSLCYESNGSGQVPRRPWGSGGSIFYDGDIVLDSEAAKYIFGNDSRRRKRAAVRFLDRLWKDGILYYKFDSKLERKARKAAKAAMKHISERTCIQFQKKTRKTKDYVRIISEPGCWSSVGRVGGIQNLSLGSGCEQVGTAIHELAHSLGFWHEHSRPDRNKYVEIDYDNISPRYKAEFDRKNNSAANSRGFPYDYESIMHYKERHFSNNGGKTIKVIGLGKLLNLSIGQRKSLSQLDTAQLRDMYQCNQLLDEKETVCAKGWQKFQTSCYRFVSRPKAQFATAKKHCAQFNSHLVKIDNKYEDEFLKKYANKYHPKVRKWRTGGRRVNNKLTWDVGEDGDVFAPVKYEGWQKHSFLGYSSLVLFKNKRAKKVEWKGDWFGSSSQLPKYAYPFICEKDSRRKCEVLKNKDGRDYRGKIAHTIEGITCQYWTSRYPHNHTLIPMNAKEENSDGLGPHNYCRNPAGQRRNRPWCFTTKEKKDWSYCDVRTCAGPLKNRYKDKVDTRHNVNRREKVNTRDKVNRKEKVDNDRKKYQDSENLSSPVREIDEDTMIDVNLSVETDYPDVTKTRDKRKRHNPHTGPVKRHNERDHRKNRRETETSISWSEQRRHKGGHRRKHRRYRHRRYTGHRKG